jgi:hypothetical protein
MRTLIALALLVGCSHPERPIANRIRDACGNAPQMSGWAMQNGMPGDPTAKDEMVVIEPEDYEVMIKWRDCVAALR